MLVSPFAVSLGVARSAWLMVNLVALAATVGALFMLGGMRGRAKLLI